jgi:hypothetical protein
MLAGICISFALAIALTRLVELPGIRLGGQIVRALSPARKPGEA